MASGLRLRVSVLSALLALMGLGCGGEDGAVIEGGDSTSASPAEDGVVIEGGDSTSASPAEDGAVIEGGDSTPASPAEAATSSSGSTLDQLYEEAKAEGGDIMFYDATGAEAVIRAIVEPLSESYPDLNIQLFSTGSTSQMAERLLTESSAGVHTADVVDIGGPGMALLMEADLIASYDSPSHDSLQDPDLMVGPDDTWVAVGSRVNLPVVNTDLLSEADWPSDWTDFATPDPAWSDQLGMLDPRLGGAGYSSLFGMYEHFGDEVADSIFEGLASVDVRLYPSATLIQEATVSGEIAITFLNSDPYPLGAIEAGAPIAMVPMESGPVTYYSTMGMLKEAPHPAGAKFLYEWLISEEGQEAQSRLFPSNPTREGVEPIDAYPPMDEFIVLDEAVAAERQEELLERWVSIMGL